MRIGPETQIPLAGEDPVGDAIDHSAGEHLRITRVGRLRSEGNTGRSGNTGGAGFIVQCGPLLPHCTSYELNRIARECSVLKQLRASGAAIRSRIAEVACETAVLQVRSEYRPGDHIRGTAGIRLSNQVVNGSIGGVKILRIARRNTCDASSGRNANRDVVARNSILERLLNGGCWRALADLATG